MLFFYKVSLSNVRVRLSLQLSMLSHGKNHVFLNRVHVFDISSRAAYTFMGRKRACVYLGYGWCHIHQVPMKKRDV